MNDNDLIDAVATKIEAATANSGWGYGVLQKQQPTQQGVPSSPTVFIQKLFDEHFGAQGSKSTYQGSGLFSDAEVQIVVTHFQVSAIVGQDPEDLSIPTASDVINQVKLYLQHRSTMAEFRQIGLKVIQVKKINNQPFVDDKDRFEFHPSFDIEIQHERTVERNTPAVTSAIGKASPISGDNQVGTFPVPGSAGETYP